MRRLNALPIALVILMCATGCFHRTRTDPDPPRPERNTIADAVIGERLTITAGVERRLSAASFLVRDVDLPDEGLLVVTLTPTRVWRPVLVTVTGTVRTFHLTDFARFHLGERSRYTAFEGRKAVLADEVRVWAPHPLPAS